MLLTTEFYVVAFCFVWTKTCLLVTLKVVMCGGILAGYLKSWLHLHLLWQIVCPTCWGLMSYTSESEHPAGLIQSPVWALQNGESWTENDGICNWNKLCLWGAGRHTLRKLTGVSQHICGRTDEKQFSMWCLFCCNRSRRLSHLWMNWN